MNNEFKQNILRSIKHNTVRVTCLEDNHYTYALFGKNDKILMVVDCYEGILPRINIEINNEHVTGLNHFAETEEQIKNNFDVTMIANRMFLKNAKQHGLIETTMNKKQLLLSKFLKENSKNNK